MIRKCPRCLVSVTFKVQIFLSYIFTFIILLLTITFFEFERSVIFGLKEIFYNRDPLQNRQKIGNFSLKLIFNHFFKTTKANRSKNFLKIDCVKKIVKNSFQIKILLHRPLFYLPVLRGLFTFQIKILLHRPLFYLPVLRGLWYKTFLLNKKKLRYGPKKSL